MTDLELATGLMLGTLEGDERERLRIRTVEDRAFAGIVGEWEDRLAPLALGEAEALPQGLFDKIEARIDASGVELPGTLTKRSGSGEWRDISPGLRIKVLNEIASAGRQTFMAELQPGAEYADHDHDQDEEIYMISGDLIIGELILK